MLKHRKNVVGVIPAKGTSRGLPGKNIRELAGKPLIVYTIEAALGAGSMDRVIVSTDDRAIGDISREAGAEVPFVRPSELALDDTPTLPVLQHAVNRLEAEENYHVDIVVLLQPVTPFRRSCDIDDSVAMCLESGGDSVVALCEVEGANSPYWQKVISGGKVSPFTESDQEYTRRQDLPKSYRLNGAIYVVSREVLMARGTLYSDSVRGHIMPRERSVDIDDMNDFMIAEYIISRGNAA